MLKSKKKKGFTLVELIAVIAILGILSAIIVPKVSNYNQKAKDSKRMADAKQILQAVQMYNAENDDIIDEDDEVGDSDDETADKLLKNYLTTWTTDEKLQGATIEELIYYIQNTKNGEWVEKGNN